MAIRLIATDFPVVDTHPRLFVDTNSGVGVGQWVPQIKHLLLCKYISAARAAAKRFPQRLYIDPFCGPGRIQVKGEQYTRPGGAVVAWLQSVEAGAPFTKMLIGDLSFERLEACEARLIAQDAPVKAFHGPANETVLEMIKEVPRGALTLVYIDPYNLALLSNSMIRTLASLPNVDFIVHFSTMDLIRNIDMELDPVRGRFDDVLPGWREKLGNLSKSSLPSRFFDAWTQDVKSLGFAFSSAMPLITNDDNRGIYRLVCFARHEMALRLWGDIARDKNHSLF
jgi:three-Cys-motif partner protein